MKTVNDSPTDQALTAFDAFLQQWIPPAMQGHLFDNDNNAAERVRNVIRAIAAQTELPLKADPTVGYAVFAQRSDEDAEIGFRLEMVSATFEQPGQAQTAYGYCLTKKRQPGVNYQICKLTEVR